MEFSIINLELSKTDRGQAYSIITGYLSDQVPKKLVAYLSEICDEARKITENEGEYKKLRSRNQQIKRNIIEYEAEDSENHLSEQREQQKHRRNVVSESENEEESFYKKRSDTRRT